MSQLVALSRSRLKTVSRVLGKDRPKDFGKLVTEIERMISMHISHLDDLAGMVCSFAGGGCVFSKNEIAYAFGFHTQISELLLEQSTLLVMKSLAPRVQLLEAMLRLDRAIVEHFEGESC